MKNERILLAVAAATMIAAPAEAAQHKGWYLGVGGGVTMQEETNFTSLGVTNQGDFDTGYLGSGSVGFHWGNGFRTEAELSMRGSSLESLSGPGAVTVGGDYEVSNAMFNMFYDIDTGSFVTPYIGGGIGYASVEADQIRSANAGRTIDGQEGVFAYQAIGGLAFALDRNWDLTVDYRYLAGLDTTFDTSSPGVGSQSDYASHNIMAGIRYSFDEAPAPVAAPAAVPPAPQPPRQAAPNRPSAVAAPQNYIIFFDFDQSVITPEAKRILASVANEYKGGNAPKLFLSGHTDRAGSDKYNVGLSMRRVSAAKKELERMGVPADAVSTSHAGEKENMVPTADGVREAQNRRVEIYLGEMKQ